MNRRHAGQCLPFAIALMLLGWTMAGAAHAQTPGGPKVLLAYDLEGVRASVERGDYSVGHPNYPQIRQSLVDEANAAIRGLLAAGASEVVLTDCHASGNTESDYPADQLPKGARLDIRHEPYDPYVEAMDATYDALVMIGMHVRSGSEGFAPHTYFGNTRWTLNGHKMSETSMVALSAARYGIPLILVAGDDLHESEVAEFSDAEYVVVKHSLGPREARARPRDEVSREIEEAARRALTNLADYEPYDLTPPIKNQFHFSRWIQLAVAANMPGAKAVNDRTVAMITDDYLDALLRYRTLSIIFYATGRSGEDEARSWEPTTTGTVDLSDINKLGTHGYQ